MPAENSRHQPSVWKGSPLTFHAERTEAGPGREQTCQQNRSDTGQRPRGELATHFVGVLVLSPGPRDSTAEARRDAEKKSRLYFRRRGRFSEHFPSDEYG